MPWLQTEGDTRDALLASVAEQRFADQHERQLLLSTIAEAEVSRDKVRVRVCQCPAFTCDALAVVRWYVFLVVARRGVSRQGGENDGRE